MKDKIKILLQPIDPSAVGLFRICFGLSLLVYVFGEGRFIPYNYLIPKFHFSYPYLDFIKPWPGDGMYWHFAVMAIAAIGITLGLFYRFCIILFFCSYTSVFFMDTILYKNHYYLISLLSFLMIFINADACFSLTKNKSQQPIYLWNIFILRYSMLFMYFHA